MKNTGALLALAVLTLSACKKDELRTPNDPRSFILGDWELESIKSKSYKGKWRIGGGGAIAEFVIHFDSTRFEGRDDRNVVVTEGEYTVIGDSLFLVDEVEGSGTPMATHIQREGNDELRLIEKGDTNTKFLGRVNFEQIHLFKRVK